MAASQSQDVIEFTKIFVLFCTLVLLPALWLSSFGVIAIMHEREADKQRRRDDAYVVLQQAEQRFGALLDASDRGLRAALEPAGASPDAVVQRLRQVGYPVGPWLLVGPNGDVLQGASLFLLGDALGERITTLAQQVEPGRPAHAFVDDPRLSSVVSMQRLVDGRAVLYAID